MSKPLADLGNGVGTAPAQALTVAKIQAKEIDRRIGVFYSCLAATVARRY